MMPFPQPHLAPPPPQKKKTKKKTKKKKRKTIRMFKFLEEILTKTVPFLEI